MVELYWVTVYLVMEWLSYLLDAVVHYNVHAYGILTSTIIMCSYSKKKNFDTIVQRRLSHYKGSSKYTVSLWPTVIY